MSLFPVYFFLLFLGYFGNLDGLVVLDRPICSKMAKVVGLNPTRVVTNMPVDF